MIKKETNKWKKLSAVIVDVNFVEFHQNTCLSVYCWSVIILIFNVFNKLEFFSLRLTSANGISTLTWSSDLLTGVCKAVSKRSIPRKSFLAPTDWSSANTTLSFPGKYMAWIASVVFAVIKRTNDKIRVQIISKQRLNYVQHHKTGCFKCHTFKTMKLIDPSKFGRLIQSHNINYDKLKHETSKYF